MSGVAIFGDDNDPRCGWEWKKAGLALLAAIRWALSSGGSAMERTIRLEARTGWGDVTTYEIGVLRRGLHDLTAEGVGLALAEAKTLLAELRRRICARRLVGTAAMSM
jgi:hypothetical protein